MSNPRTETLVERVVAGDEEAWPELWKIVEAKLLASLRRPQFLGGLSRREDDCRNVVVEVMARLRADDYRRLRAYVAARRERPDLVFTAWVLVVGRRVAIDYVRAHEEYIDRRNQAQASTPGVWRVIEELMSGSRAPGARPPITDAAAAHEILSHADDLPADQRRTLAEWLAGHSFAEIAASAGLESERQAEKLLRAAIERLRRRFRSPR